MNTSAIAIKNYSYFCDKTKFSGADKSIHTRIIGGSYSFSLSENWASVLCQKWKVPNSRHHYSPMMVRVCQDKYSAKNELCERRYLKCKPNTVCKIPVAFGRSITVLFETERRWSSVFFCCWVLISATCVYKCCFFLETTAVCRHRHRRNLNFM